MHEENGATGTDAHDADVLTRMSALEWVALTFCAIGIIAMVVVFVYVNQDAFFGA